MDAVLTSYKPGAEIARGAFAIVFNATHKATKRKYAVKIVDKKASPDDREGIAREMFLLAEVDILRSMRHPSIVAFEEFFELPTAYALIMELVPGGELFERITEKEMYSEADARTLMRNLLEAMAYVHSSGVAHRDLKPENLVLASKNTDTQIKIIDFGLGKKIPPTESYMRTMCGTPEYCAPELLKGYPYGQNVDVFAMGIIAFLVVSGYNPFKRYRSPKDGKLRDDHGKVVRRICRGTFEFHAEFWAGVSYECKDVIAKMLEPDPEKRISSAEALQHRWFDDKALGLDDNTLKIHDLSKSLAEIREFNMKRKLRSAIHSVIGIGRMDKIAQTLGMVGGAAVPKQGLVPPPLPERPPRLVKETSQPGDSLARSMHVMLQESEGGDGAKRPAVRLIEAPTTRRIVAPGIVEEADMSGNSSPATTPPEGTAAEAFPTAATVAAVGTGAVVGGAAASNRNSKSKMPHPVITRGMEALEGNDEESVASLKQQVVRERSLREAAEARVIGTQRAASRIVLSKSQMGMKSAAAVAPAVMVGAAAVADGSGGGAAGPMDPEFEKEVNSTVSQIMMGEDPTLIRVVKLEEQIMRERELTASLSQQNAEWQGKNEELLQANLVLEAQLKKALEQVNESNEKVRIANQRVAAFREAEGLSIQLYEKLALATNHAYRPPGGVRTAKNCC